MAGGRYGWQDSLGGVEPGFAEAAVMRLGAGLNEPDDAEQASRGASSTSGQTRDEEWLQPLLE